MPFPWKKTKVTRISRFVADLQSPKHRGSLVVETGFPTSLVDLFVKNRDRLKKPSKKKSRHQIQLSDPTLNPSNSHISTHNSIEANVSRESNEAVVVSSVGGGDIEEEIELVRKDDYGNKVVQEYVIVNGPDSKSVFAVVLRVFVVVILALSTKKLAVGITLSAFVLLFLEYVGAHVVCFLKPCSNARIELNSLIQKVLSLSCFKKDALLVWKGTEKCLDSRKTLIVQEETAVSDSCQLIRGFELNSPFQEIQTVESSHDMVARIEDNGSVEPDINFLGREERRGCLDTEKGKGFVEEDEDRGEVLMHKNQRSRSDKIKAKIMKKFVPKKLRSSKKGRKNKGKEPESSSEMSGYLGKIEEQEEEGNGEKQDHDDGHSPLEDDADENCKEQEELDDGISSSSLLVVENVERAKKRNSGYLILFLIVLAGLVGGRVLALVLTVALCLMLKFVGRPARPCIMFP